MTKTRVLVGEGPLSELEPRPEFTMIGRTYSTGYEQDLEYWLIRRPRETVLNAAWPWAIWYPLRRKGPFERLEPPEKGSIMREHGMIGRPYGEADLAHDVRLACHGLDTHDNDFVIGLIGKDLHPCPTWSRPCDRPGKPPSSWSRWARSWWVGPCCATRLENSHAS